MRKQTKLVALLSAAALLAVGASMTSFAGWEKDEDGIWHYYDSDDEMVTDEWRKDGSKWFYLDEDGNMLTDSWVDDEYYVGSDGAMLKNQWVKTTADEDVSDPEDDGDHWYYFGSNGKMYRDADKKKVNGKYYFFNAHGQMVYEWINNHKYAVNKNTTPSGAEPMGNASASNALDGNIEDAGAGYIWNMQYSNVVEDGSRANGWYEIDGSEDTGTDGDTDWYYFDDGEAERADSAKDRLMINDGDDAPVYRAKIKVEGKYFCFNEMGQMQTGLQYIGADKAFYYFDENGYMQTGKESNVEDDDDSYNFYFITKNGKNGQGQMGEKDNYLYFGGKRLEADDDYKIYFLDGEYYLVNNKGKIQDSKSKKYDVENGNGMTDAKFTFKNNGGISKVYVDDKEVPATEWQKDAEIPEIALYDGYFTYDDGNVLGWYTENQYNGFARNQ